MTMISLQMTSNFSLTNYAIHFGDAIVVFLTQHLHIMPTEMLPMPGHYFMHRKAAVMAQVVLVAAPDLKQK